NHLFEQYFVDELKHVLHGAPPLDRHTAKEVARRAQQLLGAPTWIGMFLPDRSRSEAVSQLLGTYEFLRHTVRSDLRSGPGTAVLLQPEFKRGEEIVLENAFPVLATALQSR